MTLQEQIKKDMVAEYGKAKVNTMLTCYRVIVGEMQREKKKELSDDKVISILRKLEKSEIELIEAGGCGEDNTDTETLFLKVVRSYLPEPVSAETITKWIDDNVDFSKLKNEKQAIGMVMKHFGPTADGSIVKQLVIEYVTRMDL